MASSVLRNPNFIALLTARSASIVGNSGAPVALAFAVLSLEGSDAADLSIVLLCKEVTQIALFIVGGTLSDRLPRRLQMLGADLIAGFSQLLAAFLLLSGNASTTTLAIAAAVNGAAFAFFYPAASAVVPQVVDNTDLHVANAVLRLGMQTATIVGAVVGGAVVTVVNPAAGFLLDATTFFLSALAVSLLRVGPIAHAGSRPSFLTELGEGWGEFKARRWLWTIVGQFAVVGMVLTGITAAIGPVLADESPDGPALWAAFLALEGCGLLVGSLISLRLKSARPLRLVVLAGAALALPPFALAAKTNYLGFGSAGLMAGIAYSMASIHWSTLMQTRVPPHLLGRLSAYDALGSWALIPVGLAVAGPLTAATNPDTVLISAGVVVLATSLPLLGLPETRRSAVRDPLGTT